MALSVTNTPKMVTYIGTMNVAAGKTLKLESTPNGEEALAELVPAGEAWEVKVNITILKSSV